MDLATLAVIFVAVALGSISKGATGMGMPLIAIPVMTAFFGLQQAVSVLVIPILVSNLWQAVHYRAERTDPRMGFLVPMLIGCGAGVVGGTWFLTTVPERGLALALGVLLLGYLGLRLARPQLVVGPEAAQKGALPAGLGAGVLHGATGISAPIGVTFIHAMRFARPAHVFAVSAMFLMLSGVHLPALAVAGVLRTEWLVQGVFALIPIAIFMPVGHWLASKLSAAAFDRLILIFLGVIGAKLVLGV